VDTSKQYGRGYRFGRRDARYARLFGHVPFVCLNVAEVRRWSVANAHRKDDLAHRAYWLGYARGLSA
jgi:hypothetical protein